MSSAIKEDAINGAYTLITADAQYADRLDLITAIEETVTTLNIGTRKTNALAKMIIDLAVSIEEMSAVEPFNRDEQWNEVDELLKVQINKLGKSRQSALKDSRLSGYKEESVVDAYDEAIKAFKFLREAACKLGWAMMENDADLDSTEGKVFNNAEELIDELNS